MMRKLNYFIRFITLESKIKFIIHLVHLVYFFFNKVHDIQKDHNPMVFSFKVYFVALNLTTSELFVILAYQIN